MAPIRETYVPVPGLDYIEPLSERKSFAKHASSTANSQIPLTPSKKSKSKTTAEVEAQAKAKAKAKTKAKAEVEPKVKAKAKSAEQPAKKRKSEQDSALDKTGDASTPIASKPRWPKSDGYSLTKNASGTKEKAATASKTKEKPKPKAAVRPSNKFLSAELVTVSDDEDSDDGDMHKGDKRQVESNGKYRRRDNDGRIGGSARGDRSMGKTDERFTTSTSRSGSEESGEESGNNINTNNTGKNEKPGLSVRTNGAAPKRARSMSASTSSTSDSSSESVHSHACDDMPKKGNGKEKERSGKNDIVSSMQSAANGRPAKRAKSSSSSNTSTSSDDSNSAYSDEDKMDVDSSIAVGIGPSAQPKLKVNGMMFNGIGDRNGTRQAPLKQQASKPLLNGTRNTTSSSDSGSDSSSSSSQSDSEGNDAMDTSSDKHIPTTTATGKALKSSRTTGTPIQVPKSRKPTSNSIRPASTPAVPIPTATATPTTPAPHLNNTPTPTITTITNQHSTITPPPPPEPLSHSSLSPSNGKQIWHITLPANIPISSIQNIPLSAIASASASASASSTTSSTPIKNPRTTPITTHNGAEYILTAGSAAEEKDAHILVATTDRSNQGQHQHQHQDQQQHREIGYRRLARNVDAVWHVRLAPPTMPFASTRRGVTRRGADADSSDGSDADGSDSSDSDDSNDAGNASSDDSEPCFRPLPPGLKMRWLPSGCVDDAS